MKATRQNPTPETPFLIIMGAMKCGTTALFEYLRAHPAVCPSRIKEPGFFVSNELRARGLDWYFKLWDFDPATHRVAMEASTDYTKFPGRRDAPARIARALHDVRLVYLMRDPIARIESQFNHEIYEGRIDWDEPILSERIVAPSRYETQLRQYLSHVPRERMLLLDAAALAADPAAVVQRVCAFAGLDPDIDWPPFERVHETQSLTRIEDWLRQGPMPFVRHLPRGVRKRIFRGPTVAKRRMSAEERAEAWKLLRPELDWVEREFGFDTGTMRPAADS